MAQNVAYPVNVPCIHRRIAGTFTAIVCSVKTNQVTVVDAVPVFPILLSLCLTFLVGGGGGDFFFLAVTNNTATSILLMYRCIIFLFKLFIYFLI